MDMGYTATTHVLSCGVRFLDGTLFIPEPLPSARPGPSAFQAFTDFMRVLLFKEQSWRERKLERT